MTLSCLGASRLDTLLLFSPLPSASGVLSEGEMGCVLPCRLQSGQAVAIVLLLNVEPGLGIPW